MAMTGETALVPAAANAMRQGATPANASAEAEPRWQRVHDLACDLTVDLTMPHFKIGDLLKLRQGSIVDARWRVGQDVPLCLNGTLIGWVEFEVVAKNLAVRLTELA
jgi:flagellar motor switch/type III secretory pathway protein FliN